MATERQDHWPEIPVRRRFESKRRYAERRGMWATATVLHWTSHLGGTSPWIPSDEGELARLVVMVSDVSDVHQIDGIIEEFQIEQSERAA